MKDMKEMGAIGYFYALANLAGLKSLYTKKITVNKTTYTRIKDKKRVVVTTTKGGQCPQAG